MKRKKLVLPWCPFHQTADTCELDIASLTPEQKDEIDFGNAVRRGEVVYLTSESKE